MRRDIDPSLVGGLYATAAFGFWGFVPLYWKAVAFVPPLQMLAHRALWCFLLMLLLMLALGRAGSLLRVLRQPRHMGLLAGTAALVAVNWLVFIWAVQHDRVLEASLGYYVNPLVNVLLGYVFLGERLRPAQRIAVLFAAAGVLNLVLQVGVLPWVSLVLALTFGFYGLIRKVAPVGALEGLTVETGWMAPVAAMTLLLAEARGEGVFLHRGARDDLMILASGLVTALPLVWFASAARRLRYTTIGFFQYLAPTGQFLLAVLVFGEAFTPAHLVTFTCIWVALIVYTVDAHRSLRDA